MWDSSVYRRKLKTGDWMALPKKSMQSVKGSSQRVEHWGVPTCKGRQGLREEDAVGISWGEARGTGRVLSTESNGEKLCQVLLRF